MPRQFELTGPAALKEGDSEIDGIRQYGAGISLEHFQSESRLLVTIPDDFDPDDTADAATYLDSIGFSEIHH